MAANGAAVATSLADLEGTDPAGSKAVYLAMSGRSGWFVWSPENHAAQVAADSQKGIYVAPTRDRSGAGGAWMRQRDTGSFFNIAWFGAVENGDIAMPLQAAIDLAQAMWADKNLPAQNAVKSQQVFIPAGYWTCSKRVRVSQPGLVVAGASRNATTIDLLESTTGFIWFAPADLSGQAIDNVGLRDLQIRRSAGPFAATDIGAAFTLTRHSFIKSVRFTNFSRSVVLSAVGSPFWLTEVEYWQNNTAFTNNPAYALSILAQPTTTRGGRADPETGQRYLWSEMIYISNNHWRSPRGTTFADIYVQGCDGLYVENSHIGGGGTGLYIDAISPRVPVVNVQLSHNFFDGIRGETQRNIYIAPKKYRERGLIAISLNQNKLSNTSIEGIGIDNPDVYDFTIDGDFFQKMAGKYGIRIAGGYGQLSLANARFSLGGGGPQIATIFLDGSNESFFPFVRISGNAFYLDVKGNAEMPQQHVLVEGNGKNSFSLFLSNNAYAGGPGLSKGFLNNAARSGVTIHGATDNR